MLRVPGAFAEPGASPPRPRIAAELAGELATMAGWLGLDGEIHEQDLDERWAICAQHELDHLNGKLFIDYLGAVKRTMITARMKKLKKERARA